MGHGKYGAPAWLLVMAGLLLGAGPRQTELLERHRKWLEEEVVYLISDYERDAFLALETNAQRDAFMRHFWDVRDPTPGTRQNEYLSEHQKRIEEANRLFGAGKLKPGWNTPRGKVYIQLGPPRFREGYPMERDLYPLELWFYQGDPALGLAPFFYLIFYKKYGVGDYELYDPVADGPGKLVGGDPILSTDTNNALGRLAGVSTELRNASLSLIASDRPDRDNPLPMVSSSRLLGRIHDLKNRQPFDKSYVEEILAGKSRVTAEYSFQQLGMVGRFLGTFGTPRIGELHYTIEIPPEGLTLERYRDRITGALELVGRIFAADGKSPVQQIEERVEIDLSLAEFESLKANPLAYQDAIPLLPGSYVASVMVRNLVSRQFGVVEGRFEVPALAPGGFALGPLMVVAQSRAVSEGTVRPYTFGGQSWYPAPSVLAPEGDVRFLYRLAYPAERARIGEQVRIQYLLLPGEGSDEEILAGFERATLNPRFDGGVATGTVQLHAEGLLPRSYRLRVVASHPELGTALSDLPFQVAPGRQLRAPWVYVRKRPRTPSEIACLAADQYLARGDEAGYIETIERALGSGQLQERETETRMRLGELRLRRKEYGEALKALAPLEVAGRNDPVLGLLLGRARSGAGDGEAAIRTLEQAAQAAPRNTEILNALIQEHLRAGDRARAQPWIEKSLAADPEQPELLKLRQPEEPGRPPR